MSTPDLQFGCHGTFITCEPMTESGQQWLDENVSQMNGDFAGVIFIEPRYLADIVEGARRDGLICEG